MDQNQWDQNKVPGNEFLLVFFYGVCTVLVLFLGTVFWPKHYAPLGSRLIGFDYSNKVPEQISGDTAAASHIFIHHYPIPSDGWLSGITYLNDAEIGNQEQQEEIFILVLRPENRIYRVIYRQEIVPDDLVQESRGETRVKFPQPLLINKGDLLAHWQPTDQAGGPIPLDLEVSADLEFSNGKAGFQFEDTSPGKSIEQEGFSGRRNYFMQAIFQPK